MTARWWNCLRKLPPRVVVYSSEPQLLRPLFAANPQVDAAFESPDKFDPDAKVAP